MFELLIGLIALMLILVGIVTFGEGGYHWLSAMNEAAAAAWSSSITPNRPTVSASFIGDWANTSGSSTMLQNLGIGYLPGTSTSVLQYNFQDTQVSGSSAAFNSTAQTMLSRQIAGDPNYIDYQNFTRPYLKSQPVLAQALQQTTTGGWCFGQSTSSTDRFALGKIDRGNGFVVDFGSGFQSLVYGQDTLYLRTSVYLPPITGLQ